MIVPLVVVEGMNPAHFVGISIDEANFDRAMERDGDRPNFIPDLRVSIGSFLSKKRERGDDGRGKSKGYGRYRPPKRLRGDLRSSSTGLSKQHFPDTMSPPLKTSLGLSSAM